MNSLRNDRRETLGFEVVVRFYPGAESEAFDFLRAVVLPDQAKWVRLDRIVTPDGEERIQSGIRSRSVAQRA